MSAANIGDLPVQVSDAFPLWAGNSSWEEAALEPPCSPECRRWTLGFDALNGTCKCDLFAIKIIFRQVGQPSRARFAEGAASHPSLSFRHVAYAKLLKQKGFFTEGLYANAMAFSVE
ncbi:hypothetical protein A9Y76_03145 [Ralstonia insidiosa]|uniref:Uncharacterized protein n=1 Tax=Ralstonia insidiosa TaxID=190721 RepID=A0A191ZTV3_9RALS|nr:hypothetical protein A9Y76_03145 [Ralstonia insidiosa]